MSGGVFGYTCEGCLSIFYLTESEFEMSVDPSGRFRCDSCKKPTGGRKRTRQRNSNRELGCTVTVLLPDGNLQVHHRAGMVVEALEEIVELLPEGAVVQCISTYRSVLRDLDTNPRSDPYEVERAALSRIGRLDLLPVSARRRRVA